MALATGVVASGPTLARSAQPQNQGVTKHLLNTQPPHVNRLRLRIVHLAHVSNAFFDDARRRSPSWALLAYDDWSEM
jgi:hypothetical protein